MRREIDINVPHRHYLTRILEATLYLYVSQRSIPRQVDLGLTNASTKAS
jgi:hypothetical protein